MEMFCRQCEQTAAGKGCTKMGVCGKDPVTATLIDLLVYSMVGIAIYGKMARELGVKDKEAELFMMEGLFSTVTNVNFAPEKMGVLLQKSYRIKEKIKGLFLAAYKEKYGIPFKEKLYDAAYWEPAKSLEELVQQGEKVGILSYPAANEDVRSLKEILLYGLKGMAAYADHAHILGKENEEVNAYFYKGLSALGDENLTVEDLVGMVMEFGKINLKCLETLDAANTEHFGNPVPTKISIGAKKGPAILVSGHDLLDLEELLKQTDGKGINIYTHGEMLPAHGYPNLKKYPHLVGNYGGAWQEQIKEFDEFPGSILMTTNCIQRPRDTYKERIFTTGLVEWHGVEHIENRFDTGQKDFSKLIDKAIEVGGFKEDVPGKEILVGFAHHTILSVAEQVIEAVKSGNLKHFYLIGGCDGAKSGRNYYTEFAESVPKNCVILTLACGKYRFNKIDFGDIGGIPRLLDCGQCNDAYSAIKVATALANAFNCGVNDLPLSLILSWYEQKAVCILLTLLSLGLKNMRIGPSLPAFVTPNVLKVLVENFNLMPITTVEKDIKETLGVK